MGNGMHVPCEKNVVKPQEQTHKKLPTTVDFTCVGIHANPWQGSLIQVLRFMEDVSIDSVFVFVFFFFNASEIHCSTVLGLEVQ